MIDTPGKVRGLQATATPQGCFTILALDHGASFKQTIRPAAPQTVTFEEVVSLKALLLRAWASEASAVLLDPVYGVAPAILQGALPGNVGLLLAVEDGDYASPQQPTRCFEGWSVAKIKRAGAAAVKCFFYYHPADEALASVQEAFVAGLVRDCRIHDLPLFAEPLAYGTTPTDRPWVVIETARRFSRLGVDVLKVEFPVDIQTQPDQTVWRSACEALSAACVGPWVLLSAGVDFATFAAQARVACQSGASGYMAGRAVWQEAVQLTGPARQQLLHETARPRLRELADLAQKYARPWTGFYPYSTEPLPQGWYKHYGS